MLKENNMKKATNIDERGMVAGRAGKKKQKNVENAPVIMTW